MIKQLSVLDERHVWHEPLIATARARGYEAKRIFRGHEAFEHGLGFIRPHADPAKLKVNIDHDDIAMRVRCHNMVQDRMQVVVYDNKTAQTCAWGAMMPETHILENESEALEYVHRHDEPLVAKADVGASSQNVYILRTPTQKRSMMLQVFRKGLLVSHSAGGGGDENVRTVQKGRIILQQFIPHTYTLRVNRIGDHYAIFKRFNGPKGTAQTGNVEPVKEFDARTDDLLNYAGMVTERIASKWVALDILDAGDRFYLIETSLAWPWPSPGDCDNAPFFSFGHHWENRGAYQWRDMWTLMLDEYERGAFGAQN